MKSDLSRNQISPNEGNETWEAALSQGEGVGEEAVALPTKAHEEARQKLLGEVKIQKRKCKLPAIFPARRKKSPALRIWCNHLHKTFFQRKTCYKSIQKWHRFSPLPLPLLSTPSPTSPLDVQ